MLQPPSPVEPKVEARAEARAEAREEARAEARAKARAEAEELLGPIQIQMGEANSLDSEELDRDIERLEAAGVLGSPEGQASDGSSSSSSTSADS